MLMITKYQEDEIEFFPSGFIGREENEACMVTQVLHIMANLMLHSSLMKIIMKALTACREY